MMSPMEEEMLLLPSFAFPECFPADAAAPGSGGEQKKAGRQRRRRKASAGDGDDAMAKKRKLNDEQAQFLEMSFRKERKLETSRKVQLAAELGLDTKQVAVWFQNRRARYKSKLIEEEFSKLRAAHDSVVVHNCHLEAELHRLKERLAETEEEKSKIMAAAAATAGGGGSSPSSSSFSTVTDHAAMVDQFEMEGAEANFAYMSDYTYNNYLMDLAAGGYLGCVYDQFS
ncbi:homeobox-leucine zipper protein HOX12-like [Lolium rigidum]|uniref:homeobox-leucine zipper protein HOX12-like n=1 Tax=Lolium rigidum TaxID=89674 RepID=UPI001F5CB9DD|nr:homeobox-leucine zipper protein HOX12-like [Lolium rigidum]XP_051183372.1 homeobox-leucine zipper protein HOX12-like isoform X2 [Lolium perenne]